MFETLTILAFVFAFKVIKTLDDRKKAVVAAEELKIRKRAAWELENNCRATARRDWFECNKVKIYINTIHGITAAMTEETYEKAQRITRYARIDKNWDRSYLKFVPGTFVVTTAIGREAVEAHQQGRHASAMISGLRSVLEQLKDNYNCELISAKDIFVPWSSEETGINLNEIYKAFDKTLYSELVEPQIPEELRPLPRGDF